MARVINNGTSVISVGDLRQKVINIHDASKGRIALFALIEMSFNDHVSREALDHVLKMIEE